MVKKRKSPPYYPPSLNVQKINLATPCLAKPRLAQPRLAEPSHAEIFHIFNSGCLKFPNSAFAFRIFFP